MMHECQCYLPVMKLSINIYLSFCDITRQIRSWMGNICPNKQRNADSQKNNVGNKVGEK